MEEEVVLPPTKENEDGVTAAIPHHCWKEAFPRHDRGFPRSMSYEKYP